MKVLLLGASGLAGNGALALLNRENLVTRIGIASRNFETAQRLAAETGEKANPVCVDIQDVPRLSSLAGDYDIILNTAGPTSEVQVPAIQAAIEAGVHYCDLGVSGRPAEEALKLDAQAQARGVTVVIGTGWCALTGLMAIHANHQLDLTEEIITCMMFDYTPGGFFSPEQFLARTRQKGRVETSGIDLMEGANGPVWTTREGHPKRIEPVENRMEVIHPSGKTVIAYPVDTLESVTMPNYLSGVNNISTLISLAPPALNELFVQQGQRIARGEMDPEMAMITFFETAMEKKEHWLSTPPGYPSGWWMWAIATGYKDGRRQRYMCWPGMVLDWTNVPLVITALRILRGDVSRHGVVPPEACFELGSFLDESAKYVAEDQRGKPLFNEQLHWLV